MTATVQFNLPDVGEGLTEAEISSWHVAVGDTIEVNQVIVEIETAKSLVELPSPHAGVVAALHAAEGDTVDVGLPIISIATEGSADEEVPADAEPKLLVGYGAKQAVRARRRRRPGAGAPIVASVDEVVTPTPTPSHVRAKPPVRRLAKELGVRLDEVTATRADGVICRDDVLAHANAVAAPAPAPVVEVPTAGGGDLRIPIKGVRKHTAAAMVSSAFTAPHVTEFVTLDVTATMELKDVIAARREFKDVKLTPLALVARAFLVAIARTPEANSRWEEQAQEIVQLRDVNLGIAAATPRGLVVPNIRGANRLDLRSLTGAINELAATARAGRTEPAAMANGTITITNVGVFGVDSGTPILNPGEAAILAVGAIRRAPWVVGTGADERIEPRWVTQLALSFDHRVMDGEQGSRLLADTAAVLRDPGLALL